MFAKTKNKIAQDIYSSRLGEELGVDKKSILTRIEQIGRKSARIESKNRFKNIQQNSMSENAKAALQNSTNIKVIKAEELFIACIYHNPDFFSRIDGEITAEDFSVADNRAIYSALSERIREGGSIEFTFFTQMLTPEQMSAFVKICKRNESFSSGIKACADCIEVIKQSKQKKTDRVSAGSMSDEEFRGLFNKKSNK